MFNKKLRILLMAFITIVLMTSSYAHSGNTDSGGCHTSSKTGEYHCHNPKNTTPVEININRAPSSNIFEKQITRQSCCKRCSAGKACGDTCISKSKTCHVGQGCACD